MDAIYKLAGEAHGYFEYATRADDESRYARTKPNTPGWVQDLVHDAHGDMLPDDWRYACVMSALDWIHEHESDDSHEFADGMADVYTSARFAWLSSNLSRQGYVDEALADFGWEPDSGIAAAIGLGQYAEASEVFGSVWHSLEERAKELDEEEPAA